MDDQQREKAEHRLRILKAVSAAVERRNEVLDAVAQSADTDEARGRLAVLMNIDEDAAEAVISMQFRRLSQRERTSLAMEIQETRRCALVLTAATPVGNWQRDVFEATRVSECVLNLCASRCAAMARSSSMPSPARQ
ncbi:DNA gyrase subunit A [Georgenia daeguensis]|uniref:DNA gyrase subunit A n=1 Tax=Georgenia daeguensis TaxID=908355 RepID=UPI0031EDC93F